MAITSRRLLACLMACATALPLFVSLSSAARPEALSAAQGPSAAKPVLAAALDGRLNVMALQAQNAFGSPAFQRTWERTDKPVASGDVKRSWYWGPVPGVTVQEDYAEGQGGKRTVQYFDKSRMEVNDPNGNPNDPFYATNGLLTVELISGKMQVGKNSFVDRWPADIALASDPDDANAPTYLSFLGVSNTPLGDRPANSRVGQPATATIARDGTVGDDPTKTSYPKINIAYYESLTRHNIPQAMWEFLNDTGPVYDQASGKLVTARLSDPWFYATGLPISEAYWAKVKVAGQMQDVLIQAFERRVVTYTPNGVPGFKVQMGNIGQHYYDWRYKGAGKPKNYATPTPTAAPTTPTPTSRPTTPTPTPDPNGDCSNIPPSNNAAVRPNCGSPGTDFAFEGWGFTPGEQVSIWVTAPDQSVIGARFQLAADANGHASGVHLPTTSKAPPGIWAVTFQGMTSKVQSIGYFKLTSLPQGPGGEPVCDTSHSRNGQAVPDRGKVGDVLMLTARGFTPGENVSFWFTLPDGQVSGTEEPYPGFVNSDGTIGPIPFQVESGMDDFPGTWAITFQGASSNNQAIIYFCVQK